MNLSLGVAAAILNSYLHLWYFKKLVGRLVILGRPRAKIGFFSLLRYGILVGLIFVVSRQGSKALFDLALGFIIGSFLVPLVLRDLAVRVRKEA